MKYMHERKMSWPLRVGSQELKKKNQILVFKLKSLINNYLIESQFICSPLNKKVC